MRDEDEDQRREAISHRIGEALDTLSVEELGARIVLLGTEIARLEAARSQEGGPGPRRLDLPVLRRHWLARRLSKDPETLSPKRGMKPVGACALMSLQRDKGAIMQGRWMMAPWMRRRIARYVERGSSERVIACLVAPAGAPAQPDGETSPAWAGAHVDLSNVILFRALSGRTARPVPPAP